jgi:hypothetical protein
MPLEPVQGHTADAGQYLPYLIGQRPDGAAPAAEPVCSSLADGPDERSHDLRQALPLR